MCRGNGGSEDCVSESASNDALTPGDDNSRQQTGSSTDVTDDVTHRRQVAAPAPTAGVLFPRLTLHPVYIVRSMLPA